MARSVPSSDSNHRSSSLSHSRSHCDLLRDLTVHVDKDLESVTYPAMVEMDTGGLSDAGNSKHEFLFTQNKDPEAKNVVEACDDDGKINSAESPMRSKEHNKGKDT